ncbi:T9SS type A sorting domain-containing protein [Flavobacterium filum]|uniref:T9SS type A sorting domain-containing protein n=1 Tax=Flavobacterium filum TaxID=370974 RepID=UPI0003F66142|nr:T9SS type A sorting domain-containing protein [Flavobacterium filum]
MKKNLLFLSLLFAFTYSCFAQNPGDVAQNFGSAPQFNGAIYVITTQPDGKILVGGNFTMYNGATAIRIIRLNIDGTIDTSFNTGTGFEGTQSHAVIHTIVTLPDGKILVGGSFITYNGVIEKYIIRLNSDGSKDDSFNSGTGFNGSVFKIALQSDGKILVGGFFTSYNSETGNNGIIRLNADGTKDDTFTPGGILINNSVYSIETQNDGKILVGGYFTSFNGSTENSIIRLNADGTKDTSFNPGAGFNNTVNTITIQTDGKILVGGYFTSFNGETENRIIRLNADGSKDTSFNSGTGFNNTVNTITTQPDGTILVGGSFTSFKGATENRIIRLNANGNKDTSFNVGIGFNSVVMSISIKSDGKILVGGNFTSFNGAIINRIINLNTNGAKNASFNTEIGFKGGVFTIATQTDGKILVGGGFTAYKEKTENKIIRLNTDGTKDNSFNTGTGFGPINTNNDILSVSEIVTQPEGKILVGGYFTVYKGATENRIIRLNADGSKDTSFNAGTGFNGTSSNVGVRTMVIQPDGKILVGGNFKNYNGLTENGIIRLNADGSKDTSFNTGTGFEGSPSFDGVNVIVIQPDGKILVGGFFGYYNGEFIGKIIRLNADGTKDASFNTGALIDGSVNSIATQNDGKILVGGSFYSFNGETVNRIIRLNADGTKDNSFNTGIGFNSSVHSISLQYDGKILLGGNFTSYDGATENSIIRLNNDGSIDTSFMTGIGFNGGISTIVIQPDGKILLGGDFTTYKGSNASASLIALHTEQSLRTTSFDNANTLVIYPNPVDEVLHIQSTNFRTINAVKIYDLQGKLVKEATNETINVSSLAEGLYIVKVETEEGEFSKKFIKK